MLYAFLAFTCQCTRRLSAGCPSVVLKKIPTGPPTQVQLQSMTASGQLQQYVDLVMNTSMPMNVVSEPPAGCVSTECPRESRPGLGPDS